MFTASEDMGTKLHGPDGDSGLGRPLRIAVVGSLNVDLVTAVDRLPGPGETVTAGPLQRYPGGKGANQAVAFARLGAAVNMIGAVGGDEGGQLLTAALSREGIDVESVRTVELPTGAALVVVEESGENQIAVSPGANERAFAVGSDLADVDGVVCQLEIPLESVEDVARRTSAFFCLNAAPASPLPTELLERADLVVVNETEYGLIDGLDRCKLVAITLGARGARLVSRGATVAEAEAVRVEAVDTVGAGDAFCAALVLELISGQDRETALRTACLAGSIVASRPGGQTSLPTRLELLSWVLHANK
jgi:ribokinase